MMKAFISWSGGKDCMNALYRFLNVQDNEVLCLLNMTDENSDRSRSHGISNRLICLQAEKMGIPLVQRPTRRESYEKNLKEDGFKAVVVAVEKNRMDVRFLGRTIDHVFLNDLHHVHGIDVCGENGEYHTFVFDGPVFNEAVPFETGAVIEDGGCCFLQLK